MKEDLVFIADFFYYADQSYLIYESRRFSFSYTNKKIKLWKSAGIDNLSRKTDLDAIGDSSGNLTDLKTDGRMHVYLSRNLVFCGNTK